MQFFNYIKNREYHKNAPKNQGGFIVKKKMLKRGIAMLMAGVLVLQSSSVALADSEKVVTLGADLTEDERTSMLQYFGVTEAEVTIVEVNNQEERKYLEGIATEAQIGKRTYSCAYIMPTNEGKINVRTANLTWVSTSMIANTLVTAGIDSCDVIAAAPKQVSGTGALTGIIKAYETVTDETLDEEKTELAMEELFETAELGSEIGQEEASAVMNEVKAQVIKDGVTDQQEVEKIVNEVADYYNVEISDGKVSDMSELMANIGAKDYDYSKIQGTMEDLQDKIVENMDDIKESLISGGGDSGGILSAIGNFFAGIFKAIGNFFSNLFGGGDDSKKEDDNTGSILDKVDDSALGIESSSEPSGEASATPVAMPEETASFNTNTEEPQSPEETQAPVSEEPNTKEDSFTVDDKNNLQSSEGAEGQNPDSLSVE